jgi:formylglycine-generating enzyme required for sulfatase activity
MKMKLKTFFVLAMLLGIPLGVSAASTTVSNVRSAQRTGTQLVDIYYDLSSPSNALTVSVAVSTNGGASYTLPATSFTGAVGTVIAPGTNQMITWNAGADWPTNFSANVRVSVTADDSVPSGMALIPAGSFTMGDTLGDGYSSELPTHTVYVSAFYMDKYDVTKALWDSVYQWATNHGYSFNYGVDYGAQGKASNHPEQGMTWYEAVKWCNARSEKEGKTPAYYTSTAQTVVYRSGQVDVDNSWVKWNAGYRLPTEAEWEKAARGRLSGQRFPWGNTISETQANYHSCYCYTYDLSNTGYNPTFNDGVYPYTSPVGYFAPNGYGLYDMAGNVWQSCWDWYGDYSSGSQTDPRGPTTGQYGSDRVIRGAGWNDNAFDCRAAYRGNGYPAGRDGDFGFRSVLSPSDLPAITVQPLDRNVSKGGTVTFNVTATGGTPLYYQWQKNGVDITSATGASLTLTNVQSAGYYSVVISNGIGIITSRSAHLTVSGGTGEI